jgi:hypothetical protein
MIEGLPYTVSYRELLSLLEEKIMKLIIVLEFVCIFVQTFVNMNSVITYQKIRKESVDKYVLAGRYYSVLSVLNDLKLTEREIQLVSYAAIRGNISSAGGREEFCSKYNTSGATINNMISRLRKIGVMVKDGGKIKVNPRIVVNFERDVILEIKLAHERV